MCLTCLFCVPFLRQGKYIEITFQPKSKDEQQVIAGKDVLLSPPRKGRTMAQAPSPKTWLLGNSSERTKDPFTCCSKYATMCKAAKKSKAKIQLVTAFDFGCSAGAPVFVPKGGKRCLNFDLFENETTFPQRIADQELMRKLAVETKENT